MTIIIYHLVLIDPNNRNKESSHFHHLIISSDYPFSNCLSFQWRLERTSCIYYALTQVIAKHSTQSRDTYLLIRTKDTYELYNSYRYQLYSCIAVTLYFYVHREVQSSRLRQDMPRFYKYVHEYKQDRTSKVLK